MHALDSDIDSENDSEENDELLYDYNGVDPIVSMRMTKWIQIKKSVCLNSLLNNSI